MNAQNIWDTYRGGIIFALIALILLMMSAYVVNEEEQVVVIRAGEPVRTVNTPDGVTNAGLYLKVPLIETARRVERRVLDLEMRDEEVLSSDQQRLLVNAYARFRIIDPVRMVERAGTTDGVRTALEPILNSVLRQELGRRTFAAMLTAERGTALANIRDQSGPSGAAIRCRGDRRADQAHRPSRRRTAGIRLRTDAVRP